MKEKNKKKLAYIAFVYLGSLLLNISVSILESTLGIFDNSVFFVLKKVTGIVFFISLVIAIVASMEKNPILKMAMPADPYKRRENQFDNTLLIGTKITKMYYSHRDFDASKELALEAGYTLISVEEKVFGITATYEKMK